MRPDDINCPSQKGLPVSAKWCDRNQHREYCRGCRKDLPEVSKYQHEEQEREASKERGETMAKT